MELDPATVWLVALAIGFLAGLGGIVFAAYVLPIIEWVIRGMINFCVGVWYGLTEGW